MKIHTIVFIRSNICEVTTKAFINYNKAIVVWERMLEEHRTYADESEAEQAPEEYLTDPFNKWFEYDDGEYFNGLAFETHEVEE